MQNTRKIYHNSGTFKSVRDRYEDLAAAVVMQAFIDLKQCKKKGEITRAKPIIRFLMESEIANYFNIDPEAIIQEAMKGVRHE